MINSKLEEKRNEENLSNNLINNLKEFKINRNEKSKKRSKFYNKVQALYLQNYKNLKNEIEQLRPVFANKITSKYSVNGLFLFVSKIENL